MELSRAGSREVGGVLLGEQLQADTFRLVELTVQRDGATAACFVRRPETHRAAIEGFFERTGHDYQRFNYLGEWHSHPQFPAAPSATDLAAMQRLVEDDGEAPPFAILLIARLDDRRSLQLSAVACRPGMSPTPVQLEIAARPQSEAVASTLKAPPWWRRFFSATQQPLAVTLIRWDGYGDDAEVATPTDGC